MFIDVKGNKVFTVSFGAGKKTLLAHSGWLGAWDDWMPTLEKLSTSWRTVAYDHRGTGETMADLESIVLNELVDDIFRVMDRLEIERCTLGGFSSGTTVTLLAYLKHPERFDGLIFANGSGSVYHPDSPPRKAPPLPSNWPGVDHAGHMKWFVDMCLPEANVDEVHYWANRILTRNGPEVADRLWESMVLTGLDLTDRLGEISVPTLLIHGSKDPFCSLNAMQYIASKVSEGKLVVIDGVGHLPLITRPQEVADAINGFFYNE